MKRPVQYEDLWVCKPCNKEFYSPEKMREHLKTIHGITKFSGKRTMILHTDSDDHYTSVFDYKIGQIVLQRCVTNPRTPRSALYSG